MRTYSGHSLPSFSNMENHGELGLLGENFDLGLIGRIRDDEYESRSGSDNLEGGSGEDQDAAEDRRPRKKKYHRHTPLQIQELEAFFKECPHPDEKQRSELSRRLALENKQVKFWFQNRRTQMKTQIERHENIMLRQENEKLRAENSMIKDAVANPMCTQCGGPAILGQISIDDHQLRIENARLKDELSRISALANKFLGRPLSSLAAPLPLPIPPCLGFGAALNPMMTGLDMVGPAPMGNEVPFERSVLAELALAAMDEFMKLVQAEAPLWVRSPSGTRESLNYEEYVRTFRPCLGPKPGNFVSEATRDTSLAIINGLSLVETLMDSNRWTEMFPCLVARASTLDMLSAGMNGTRNGTLQVMQVELQVLSPLVPIRPLKFLRFCKQHAEGIWAVVDVSIDINREPSNSHSFLNSRRLPSGCLVQDMPDGSSKVIWVEHSEYDENGVHQMFRPYLSSGMGFGSQRWLATLQRQCESLASLMSHSLPPDDQTGMSPNGRRSMVKLGKRMVDNFCSGVCGWTARKWEKLCVGEDVRIMTRKSMDDPGEPPGVILCAATSVWVPVSPKRLFGFLSDIRMRTEWDILSNGGPMHEMVHISKGPSLGNHVSLLRGNGNGTSDSAMLILQETWTDESGSVVVYAPVDTSSINAVMHGGDSAYVALLPSGFAILPDGSSGSHLPQSNVSTIKGEIDDHGGNGGGGGGASGCLLTVGFQILVNSLPTAKLTVESVETVNNLISCTIRKIKTALHVPTSA